MKKRNILLISVVLIVIIVILTFGYLSLPKGPICGNGVCELSEDCNSCEKDCGCKAEEYCDGTGICRKEVCGDDVCSAKENATKACCVDCGCLLGEVCNKFTNLCQKEAKISETEIERIVNDYLTKNNITGKIKGISDTYYQNQTIKQVTVDCRPESATYLCAIILYIDESGTILEAVKTV